MAERGKTEPRKASAIYFRFWQAFKKAQANTQMQAVGAVKLAAAAGQFVHEGLDAALYRKKPTGRQYRMLDGVQEAKLVAIACSQPPGGGVSWTLKLLAGRMVELQIVESISRDTVRRTLKKTNCSPTARSAG